MPINEIRVTPLEIDTLGNDVKQEAHRTLGLEQLEGVRTATVYRVEGISDQEAQRLADELFTDPVAETYSLDAPVDFGAAQVVEVGYQPGIMNPAAASIVKAAKDLGIHPVAVDTSREYAFYGDVDSAQTNHLVGRLLMNTTVERVITEKPATLTVEGSVGPIATVPIRDASEAELAELSKDKLFLDNDEMGAIQQHFRRLDRDPTDVEVEIIAASWSDHCRHKTFIAPLIVDGAEKDSLYQRIKAAAKANFKDLVVSAFDDNSGVMRFYDGMAVCGKVETHNSPSALEPYGGAMTGSGGVFRDIMGTGQGARTIVSTDMFCFAPPDLDETMLPIGTLSPDYLQRQVVQGVRDYGNRMGIPTANGSVHYHEDFRAKPTVIVGAYGILPETQARKGEPELGDQVVIIGGRTGKDGIHGATFSSGEMTDRTASVNSSAVQIGNAIEEKRMFDALIEARDLGYIRAITDCGAAGFSSAIGEIGEDIGVTVDISKVPLKYQGLSPWEIWVSESQERMVTAISPENVDVFLAVCLKHNVEATVIGEFDGSNSLTVNYGDQKAAELDYEFLKNGMPQKIMPAHWERPAIPEIRPKAPANREEWINRFKAVLAHGNVCSKEPIVRQYDHGVQGSNITAPFGGPTQEGPNDALVVRPMLDKPYGMVQSHGMNPLLMRIDPYQGTVWAIAEAAANYVSAGGNIDEATAVGNYIWPSPTAQVMGSLDRSVDAAVEMMNTLKLPVISGKDSLSSTYRSKDGEVIEIPPVYAMSIFGRIPDVEKTMTTDIKHPGDSQLFLIGKPAVHSTGKPRTGMGGSTYYDVTDGSSASLPKVNVEALPATLKAIQHLIQSGIVTACHDVSEGGVATAVAEMCFGSSAGAVISLPNSADRESFLFNETAGCFVVEVPKGTANIHLEFAPGEVEIRALGKTTRTPKISANQYSDARGYTNLFEVSVDELKQAWQAPMEEIFHD